MDTLKGLAGEFGVPVEDVTLIALNKEGVDYRCSYDRLRAQLHFGSSKTFEYANQRQELDHYLALPIHTHSPFKLNGKVLRIGNDVIGKMHYTTEDICNSHYWRRERTALNINPNRRTECRGCGFCYAIYQIPNDNKKLKTERDFIEFFSKFLAQYGMRDLSELIEISMVTGCYQDGQEVVDVIKTLCKVASEHFKFAGKVFYLGSQIDSVELLQQFSCMPSSVRICFSVEVFERRDILRANKRTLTVDSIYQLMQRAMDMGIETSFSYVLGLEPLDVVTEYFARFNEVSSMFPIVNILQVHRRQSQELHAIGANSLRFYLEARKAIEQIYLPTDKRPEPWRDYRSPWALKFANEELTGQRTPHKPGESEFLEPHDLIAATSF